MLGMSEVDVAGVGELLDMMRIEKNVDYKMDGRGTEVST